LSTTPNLDVSTSPAVAIAARARPRLALRHVLPWVLVVLLATGLSAISLMYLSRAPKAQSLLRSSISLPRGFSLDPNNSSLALSPDGRRLVFAAAGDDGKGQQLWLRSMDSLTIQPLAGTIGPTYPSGRLMAGMLGSLPIKNSRRQRFRAVWFRFYVMRLMAEEQAGAGRTLLSLLPRHSVRCSKSLPPGERRSK